MRQSGEDNVLATAEDLLKDKIIFSYPLDQSCSAQDEPLVKRTTRDLPLDESLRVGISVWENTDVVPSDLLCQRFHASYAVCCQHTLKCTLCGECGLQINDAGWTDTKIGSSES